MGLYRTEAVVLGHKKLGEADKILTLFSPEKGKIHAVARGVCRPRNHLIGGTQLFSYSSFLLFNGKSLDTIGQCEVKESFFRIREELNRMAYGLYFAELLQASTPAEEKNRHLFYFFLKTLHLLQNHADLELLSRIYEIKLMALQGFAPQLSECVMCGEEVKHNVGFSPALGGIICSKCHGEDSHSVNISMRTLEIMKRIMYGTYESINNLDTDKIIMTQLKESLRLFIEYHINKKLKTTMFLNDVYKLDKLNKNEA
jgi:DNA repair protein RecO (recombination protein O)